MAGEEPIVSGMAGRYATAVFELAREENTLDLLLHQGLGTVRTTHAPNRDP